MLAADLVLGDVCEDLSTRIDINGYRLLRLESFAMQTRQGKIRALQRLGASHLFKPQHRQHLLSPLQLGRAVPNRHLHIRPAPARRCTLLMSCHLRKA